MKPARRCAVVDPAFKLRAPEWESFALPKGGHAEEEYEDAFAVSAAWPFRVAVADGATEAAFAGAWARTLADGYVEAELPDAEALERRVEGWRARWTERVREPSRGLPWYAQAKVEQGAHATLLGLTLHADGGWSALAVGDCVLFHLPAAGTHRAWPVDRPDAFTNRPALLASLAGRPEPAADACSGTWEPGDRFLLATDALAAWLLRTGPADGLARIREGFEQAVLQARAEGALRNDDVTLVVVEMPHPSA